MAILAIETSSRWCSVAIFNGEANVCLRNESVDSGASHLILPWIDSLLKEINLTKQDISLIAVSQGPGAFTGIRLGVGIAQGLAQSLQKPLLPIVSLDALVAQYLRLNQNFSGGLLVMLDARMSQYYWAKYLVDGQNTFTRKSEIALTDSSQIDLHGISRIIGNGFDPNAGCFGSANLIIESDLFPSALGVAYLAAQRMDCQPHKPEECLPLYIRDKVAQTTQERASQKNNALQG